MRKWGGNTDTWLRDLSLSLISSFPALTVLGSAPLVFHHSYQVSVLAPPTLSILNQGSIA